MPRHYKISECMYCKLCQIIPWCTACCARQYRDVLHAVPDNTVMYCKLCQTIPWCTTCCARQHRDVLPAVPDNTIMYYMLCQTLPLCTTWCARQYRDVLRYGWNRYHSKWCSVDPPMLAIENISIVSKKCWESEKSGNGDMNTSCTLSQDMTI